MKDRYKIAIPVILLFMCIFQSLLFLTTQLSYSELIDEQGTPYMSDSDPYHFLYMSKIGDKSSLLSFLHTFIPLSYMIVFYPLLCNLICIFLAYKIIFKITKCFRWGYIAAGLLLISNIYLFTTYPGYVDTIALNQVFLMLFCYNYVRGSSILWTLPILLLFKWHWSGYLMILVMMFLIYLLRQLRLKNYKGMIVTCVIWSILGLTFVPKLFRNVIDYIPDNRFIMTRETMLHPDIYSILGLVLFSGIFIVYSWHFKSTKFNFRAMPLYVYYIVLCIPGIAMIRFTQLFIIPLILVSVLALRELDKNSNYSKIITISISIFILISFFINMGMIWDADPHNRVFVSDEFVSTLDKIPLNSTVISSWYMGSPIRGLRPDLRPLYHNSEPKSRVDYLSTWLCNGGLYKKGYYVWDSKMIPSLNYTQRYSDCELDCYSNIINLVQSGDCEGDLERRKVCLTEWKGEKGKEKYHAKRDSHHTKSVMKGEV